MSEVVVVCVVVDCVADVVLTLTEIQIPIPLYIANFIQKGRSHCVPFRLSSSPPSPLLPLAQSLLILISIIVGGIVALLRRLDWSPIGLR